MQLTEKDLPIKSECRGKLDSLLDRTDLVASTKEQIGGYDKLIDLIQTGVYDPPSKFMKPDIDKLKKERALLYKEISDKKEEVLAALNEFLVCECNGKVLEIVEDRGAIPGEILAIKGGKIIRCPE